MLSRILVPFDFSALSRAAVKVAHGLAQSLAQPASITLVHVAEREITPDPPTVPGERLESQGSVERARLAPLLEQEAKALGAQGSSCIVIGEPAQAILDLAARDQYELIVLGTQGRTGVSRLVLGSVAERVLRAAPCPVLTVGRAALERTRPSTNQALGATIGPFV